MKNNSRKTHIKELLIAGVLSFTTIFTSLHTADMSVYGASAAEKNSGEVVLRVSNWEEYIDLGEWDEEEAIELEDGTVIFGENSLVDDFEQWYEETYGIKVRVEYSCFGTNEDLYNQLTMGDVYDIVCPSDYMLMKLMAEKKLVPFSQDFFDANNENNYYIRGLSPYIKNVFDTNEIGGEAWSKYAAGYMWGITGVLYNPEYMTDEEASTWAVFANEKFNRKITLKDNVRDTYFAILGMIRADLLTSTDFVNAPDYLEMLDKVMNDISTDTINEVEGVLQDVMRNIYALETDSGKADMITGKIIANYQWSGDAVYAMDQAEEDDVYLKFQAPKECTNLWFDGWCMLKNGIEQDSRKQHAAEAFVNFLSRPDNVVRNMYYIGYTSVIAGEDDTIFQYLNYNYGAEEEAEDNISYPVGYFFTGDNQDEDYVIVTTADQEYRQLYTQYPSEDIINRAAVMSYFDDKANREINQMWINVRCFNIKDVPLHIWIIVVAIVGAIAAAFIINKKNKL